MAQFCTSPSYRFPAASLCFISSSSISGYSSPNFCLLYFRAGVIRRAARLQAIFVLRVLCIYGANGLSSPNDFTISSMLTDLYQPLRGRNLLIDGRDVLAPAAVGCNLLFAIAPIGTGFQCLLFAVGLASFGRHDNLVMLPGFVAIICATVFRAMCLNYFRRVLFICKANRMPSTTSIAPSLPPTKFLWFVEICQWTTTRLLHTVAVASHLSIINYSLAGLFVCILTGGLVLHDHWLLFFGIIVDCF